MAKQLARFENVVVVFLNLNFSTGRGEAARKNKIKTVRNALRKKRSRTTENLP
jgi:hypothetical protein